MLSNVFDNQTCFVCYRVADMAAPRVPSVRRPCDGCDAPILNTEEIAYRTAQRFGTRCTDLAGRETERFPKCSIRTLSTV